MTFWIQASSPRITGVADPDDRDITTALQGVFPLWTEHALLVWNHAFVPLSYKLDLSIMSMDVLEMLALLLDREAGTHDIAWPSNSFRVDWTLAWSGSQLFVDATWDVVLGRLQPVLADAGSITVERGQFLGEWKAVLDQMYRGLTTCGYSQDRVEGMRQLDAIRRRIPQHGVLYSQSSP